MYVKFWIICAGVLIANTTLAETPRAELFLGNLSPTIDNEKDDTILWQPIVDGLSRYQLKLPLSAVKNSLKYNDTAALFYMSQRNDVGVQLQQKPAGKLRATITSDNFGITFTQHHTPSFAFRFGIENDTISTQPTFGSTWRNITGHLRLDSITANFQRDQLYLSWMRTELADDEKSETLYGVSIANNEVQAQLGTRWFDLFPNSDFVGEIGYESEQLLFAAQLEHNFGLSDWSIGATVNSTTRQASIIFGIKFDVGKKAEVFTSTPKILQSSENNSLKALRRSSLSSLWRKNVQITQKPFLKQHK